MAVGQARPKTPAEVGRGWIANKEMPSSESAGCPGCRLPGLAGRSQFERQGTSRWSGPSYTGGRSCLAARSSCGFCEFVHRPGSYGTPLALRPACPCLSDVRIRRSYWSFWQPWPLSAQERQAPLHPPGPSAPSWRSAHQHGRKREPGSSLWPTPTTTVSHFQQLKIHGA
jgi:hypothetical protein